MYHSSPQRFKPSMLPKESIPNACFRCHTKQGPGKQFMYSVTFSSPAEGGKVCEPCDNGGFYMRGRWRYKDERTARAATFSVAAIEWERNGTVQWAVREICYVEKNFILQSQTFRVYFDCTWTPLPTDSGLQLLYSGGACGDDGFDEMPSLGPRKFF